MRAVDGRVEPDPPRHGVRSTPAYLVLSLLVFSGVWASLSLDVVKTSYGVKGDESTYVSMALSIADDQDVSFQRADVRRFWQIFGSGPEGIFLKRGKRLQLHGAESFPYVRLQYLDDDRPERLYFGKALIYPLVVAPFVWLAGMNGFWLFHALLLGAILLAGYQFLAARSPALPAFLFATAFVGASITPLYGVYLSPDLFNFGLIFLAYFVWLYKEVAPPDARGWVGRALRHPHTDYLAVLLLGLAAYSKVLFLPLAGPMVACLWWRRRFVRGLAVGLVYVLVFVACFALNVAVTGEANYQGGDRKTFYGSFPFQTREANFDNTGVSMTTNDPGPIFDMQVFWPRLGHNIVYFLFGRHFGFALYFFPGFVVIITCLWRWRSLVLWQVLGLLTFAGTAAILLVMIPEAWSGGGGPVGNRYFLPVYAMLVFLAPPFERVGPALVAWIGGTLFTGHILLTPFSSAKNTWVATERGAARLFPVELTMINDLPIQLSQTRSRVQFGGDSNILLYLLDENSSSPEPDGLWVAGRARADILVRSYTPVSHLTLVLDSPVLTSVRLSAGGDSTQVTLQPSAPATVDLRPSWVTGPGPSYGCVLSTTTDHGFVPLLTIPQSVDARFLGVRIQRLRVW